MSLVLFMSICDGVASVAFASDNEELNFVGCRPSVQECSYSCGNLKGHALIEPEKCDPDSPLDAAGGLACYCQTDEKPQMPIHPVLMPHAPQGKQWKNIGCQSTPSSCQKECPENGFYSVINRDICRSTFSDSFACFCLISADLKVMVHLKQ